MIYNKNLPLQESDKKNLFKEKLSSGVIMTVSTLFQLIFILSFCFSVDAKSKHENLAKRYELLSGVRKSKDERTFWNRKYNRASYIFGKSPAKFLAQNYHYIPIGSKVLDIGMGEGRNAVFLARKGYNVTGIDISSVAISKARYLAKEFGVRIKTILASIMQYNFPPKSFDAIICFYFVDRKLNEKILSWLKPGGILIYEAYTDHQRKVKGSEKYDKRYLLRPGELLTMFNGPKILKYAEPLHLKKFTTSIILQRPLMAQK